MKTTLPLLSMIIALSFLACEKKSDIKKRQILFYQTSPVNDLMPSDSSRIYELDYKVAVESLQDHAYVLYRIVSKHPLNNNLKQTPQFDILHSEILQAGLLDELASSADDSRYKELDFNYKYRLHQLFPKEAPHHFKSGPKRESFQQGIGQFNTLQSFELVSKNYHKENFKIVQDIGIIVYQVPFPKIETTDYDTFTDAYEALKNNHQLNLDSLSKSKKYYRHLILPNTNRNIAFGGFDDYIERMTN